MPPDENARVADPFTQFWSDAMSRMGMAAQPAPPSATDAMKQMQRVFLDALAKYCDDFMRSPMLQTGQHKIRTSTCHGGG